MEINNMSDGQVTGGVLSVMERVKTGDYEHKEVRVELHFNVLEGKDYRDLFDAVGAEATAKVSQMLGRTKAATKEAVAATRKPPKIDVVVQQETLDADTSKVEVKVPDEVKNVVVVTTGDPAAMDFVGPLGAAAGSVSVAPIESVSSGSGTLDDLTALPDEELTAARQYSDKDLTDAITTVNARLIKDHAGKGTPMIRALIAKYVPAGQPARSIAADKRGQFVQELEALK
jgi:hypothetical protein